MTAGVAIRTEPSTEELTRLLQTTNPENILTDAEWRPIERAVMLAPTLDICKALLRGERVPLSRLNQDAVRRYGVRRAG